MTYGKHTIRRRQYDRDVDWDKELDWLWTVDEPTGELHTAKTFDTWPEALQYAASHDGGAVNSGTEGYETLGWVRVFHVPIDAFTWLFQWRCTRCQDRPMVWSPARHDAWHYEQDKAADLATPKPWIPDAVKDPQAVERMRAALDPPAPRPEPLTADFTHDELIRRMDQQEVDEALIEARRKRWQPLHEPLIPTLPELSLLVHPTFGGDSWRI